MKGPFASVSLLFLAVWLLFPLSAYATYEVSDYTPDLSEGNEPLPLTDDLNVNWTDPTFTGDDALAKYVYVWNNSSAQLPSTDPGDGSGYLNADEPDTYTPYGGTLLPNSGNIATLEASAFADADSGTEWYLHLMTVYLDSNNGYQPTHSTDVVIGPFAIDNVVSGTLGPISDTRETTISLTLGVPNDLATNGVYVAESASRPMTGTDADSAASYTLQDTTPGTKTIYVWFEDLAGNISTVPESQQFELLGAVSIDPNTATIDLSSNDSQVFAIQGTTSGYDWSITNETPDTPGDDVAQITTAGYTNTTQVTVQGLNPGTFTMHAVLSGGTTGGVDSGTITVSQSASNVDIALKTGWNLISLPITPTSTAITDVLNGIAGNYTIVWGEFDPTTTAWKSYNPAKSRNTLSTMQPGIGYWIEMTTDDTLTVTGSQAQFNSSLAAGWNLIGYNGDTATDIATVLSSISGNYSIVWGDFDPTTTAWKSYNPAKSRNTLSQMQPGHGYWIEISSDSTLTY